MGKLIDLTGQKFSKLTVVNRANDYVSPKGHKLTMWLCDCECGNTCIVQGKYLKDGHTKSCGCYQKEFRKGIAKLNDYNLSNEQGIGYTSNTNETFLFDRDDYDKIKSYTWFIGKNGYLYTHMDDRILLMHRIILNITNENILVDHINHNKLDNRKCNLRTANYQTNSMNRNAINNTSSGFTGVCIRSDKKKYEAHISIDYQKIHLGSYNTFTEAVKERIKAEIKYYGDYMYQPHLKVLDYINRGNQLVYGDKEIIDNIMHNN